jgi:[acyl-carrier-protein] S-malonyltransferase
MIALPEVVSPDTTVATVAGRPIPSSWVEERLDTLVRGRLGRHLPPGESGEKQRLRRWIVQELVARMVLLHEAEQAGLWSWPDADGRGGHDPAAPPEVPDDVLDRLFERVTMDVVVPAAEIDAYLATEPEGGRQPEARRITYVIAADPAEALARLGDLREAATLDELREATTLDGLRRARTGEMWLRRGELVGPLEDAAFEATVGDVVGPFELEQGWTAARLDEVRPASRPSHADARARAEAELLRHARARAFDAWIDDRRAALAEISPGYEHPGHPVHGVTQHRH